MRKNWVLTSLGLLIALVAILSIAWANNGSQLPESLIDDNGAAAGMQDPNEPEEPAEPEDPVEPEAPVEEEQPAATADPGSETESVSDGDGSDIPWLWIAVAGGVIVIFFLLIGAWMGRGSSASTTQVAWRDRALAAASVGAAIHDSLAMQAAGGTGAGASGVEQERWRNAERRMNDLSVQLHGLEDGQPNAKSSDSTARLLEALNTLRFAMQSHVSARTQETPVAQQIEESAAAMRTRLAEFDAALATFKAGI